MSVNNINVLNLLRVAMTRKQPAAYGEMGILMCTHTGIIPQPAIATDSILTYL